MKSNIRIIDIAKLSGVSVGTVDRILHNRGKVSAEKREKVERILKDIDYSPNMVARFLASKRSYKFAIVVPAYSDGEYWELVCSGIETAVHELKDFQVSVDYLFFDQYDGNSFSKVIRKIENTEYSGVIIATLFGNQVIKLSAKLNEKQIPYVYIDSNIPDQKNLSYFGADSYMSGAIAAKLMMAELGKQGDIIIAHAQYIHSEFSTQITNRESGFVDYLKDNKFEGNLIYLDFITDTTENLARLNIILKDTKEAVGGIVFNSKIYELVPLVQFSDNKLVTLIGYDPIWQNIEAIKAGKISFLIAQRSVQQGYDSVKSLCNYLIFNTPIEKEHYMPIDILVKENIDYYNNYRL